MHIHALTSCFKLLYDTWINKVIITVIIIIIIIDDIVIIDYLTPILTSYTLFFL